MVIKWRHVLSWVGWLMWATSVLLLSFQSFLLSLFQSTPSPIFKVNDPSVLSKSFNFYLLQDLATLSSLFFFFNSTWVLKEFMVFLFQSSWTNILIRSEQMIYLVFDLEIELFWYDLQVQHYIVLPLMMLYIHPSSSTC